MRMILREQERRALADTLRAQAEAHAAQERFMDALHRAVDAGVPKTQLSAATGIPRATLLRRLADTQ